MRYLLLFFVALLAGCSSMAPNSRWLEAGHGALILADTLQTMQGQNTPDCYREVGTPRALFGPHPSDAQITGYGALHFAIHGAVSGWLDRMVDSSDDDGWRVIRGVWHVVTFGAEIKTVTDNRHEGLGFNPNAMARRCLEARTAVRR